MRQYDVLSITIAPALTARGLCSAETLAPGELSTMSTPLKSNLARSWTFSTRSSPNEVWRPTDCYGASATTSSTGKFRSAKICSISRRTLPVAPTTATLYPMAREIGVRSGFCKRQSRRPDRSEAEWRTFSLPRGSMKGPPATLGRRLLRARPRGLDDGQPEVAVLAQELHRVLGRAGRPGGDALLRELLAHLGQVSDAVE